MDILLVELNLLSESEPDSEVGFYPVIYGTTLPISFIAEGLTIIECIGLQNKASTLLYLLVNSLDISSMVKCFFLLSSSSWIYH